MSGLTLRDIALPQQASRAKNLQSVAVNALAAGQSREFVDQVLINGVLGLVAELEADHVAALQRIDALQNAIEVLSKGRR